MDNLAAHLESEYTQATESGPSQEPQPLLLIKYRHLNTGSLRAEQFSKMRDDAKVRATSAN